MSLIPYNAILVADKPGIEVLMNIYLKKAGVANITMAHSLREAVTKASQLIPHIIVVYEDTADATSLQIVEALRKQPTLNSALIFVIKACTQQELVGLIKLKVASVISKSTDPNIYIQKIKQKLDLLAGLSPYSLAGSSLPNGSKAALKIPLKIMGKANNHVVCVSPITAPSGTTLSIQPENRALESFMVTFSANDPSQTADGNYNNYFSLAGIIGRGRGWLQEKLASIQTEAAVAKKRLLIFERSRERFEPLRKMLKFHDIDSEFVDSIANLCTSYKMNSKELPTVYFAEPLLGSSGISWDKTKKEVTTGKPLVEIIATSAFQPLAKSNVIWLQKPFGIDQLVQSVQSVHAIVGESAGVSTMKAVPCNSISPVQIVALDESGGVLLSEICPVVNCEITIVHAFINDNPIFGQARVASVSPSADDPLMSVVRFVFASAASSKEKYWASVSKLFDSVRSSAQIPI